MWQARAAGIFEIGFQIALDRNGFEYYFQFTGSMFICLCHVTTDSEIRRLIQEGATALDAIGEACGAGTGCGACRQQIHDMLEAAGHGCERACADCPRPRIPVALPLTADSREAA
jgi:bacterioferritin-associated ferredoxin